jgi:transcriptional regulator with XRE-family HTH domain
LESVVVISRLKEIMSSRGIKQSHFVRKYKIGANTMSALYRGTSLPTIGTALIIAKELRLNVEEIWYIIPQD